MDRKDLGLVLLESLVLFVACASSPSPEGSRTIRAPASTPSSPPAEPSHQLRAGRTLEEEAGPSLYPDATATAVERKMRSHYQDALAIRRAVIAGRPAEAQRYAMLLALSPSPAEAPRRWRELAQPMQVDARRVASATSAVEVAAATAQLAADCGRCHLELGGPEASVQPWGGDGAQFPSGMQRHQWASDQLWDGLAVPSNEAWARGARAFGDMPSPIERADGGRVQAVANELRKLATLAPAQSTTDGRVILYAQLLVTCGACHRAVAID